MDSCTVPLAKRLLKLWFESKTRYAATMKKDTKKREWIAGELKKFAADQPGSNGIAPPWMDDLDDKRLKNKIEYLKV